MCRKTSEDSVRACLQDMPSCALYAVFGIFPKSRYRQTCWVKSIQLQMLQEVDGDTSQPDVGDVHI